ncbi:TonB-dependent receptor [Novosphingobium sp.]|uniref:TonB-dependent receptor n=1 Tax=Novosphingobium sp. TaxID=1874826 RepID=UPI0026019664|nr:TonB-dependent receptor [Novosphingobium sp.]
MTKSARVIVKALSFSGCALCAVAASSASAQASLNQPPAADAGAAGVQEIVVTAQRRSQNQQDVPISLTALDAKTLLTNRVTNAIDLGSAVPNLAARATGGGALIPAFTMRGVTSYGVVPGSDKEISIYLDGVYIGSTVGSAIDLPEVNQVEVLRGPQGTLFGRNSTAGAISVATRNPTDKFGISQDFTVGNLRQFRSKTRVDLGAIGPFSATVSFQHEERRGEVRNLGAGTVWTIPASAGVPTTQVSPEWLGSKNVESVFAAIKFEPSADFTLINKFDWTGQDYTPPAADAVGVNPATLGPLGGGYFGAVLATQDNPPLTNQTGKRPKAVNNSFVTPSYVRNWGDSLTATYRVSSNLTLKNIFAYRESYLRARGQLGGFGDLKVTAALAAIPGFEGFKPIIGSPFVVYGTQQVQTSKQWSDELQANYESKALTMTVGLLYFHLTTTNGGRPGMPNSVVLAPVPFQNIGFLNPTSGEAVNSARSLAAYAQSEVHVSPKFDLVAGIRVTNDRKTGAFFGATPVIFPVYNRTLPSYTLGANYKPNQDVLLYAKFSHANVSGGRAGTIVFAPEFADSIEAGIKSEWFDRRLRANLSVYSVLYRHLQAASAGINVGHPELGLVVVDQGNVRAKGFELETTLVPATGVTLGAAVGYTDVKFTYLNPASGQGASDSSGMFVPATLNNFFPTLQPRWTSNLSAQYDTKPVFGASTMSFRVDASWRDKQLTNPFTVYQQMPQYSILNYSPATWLVNARVSLDHIKLPVGEGQIALWAKNLTDAKQSVFPDIFGFIGVTEYQPARTFGLDVNLRF